MILPTTKIKGLQRQVNKFRQSLALGEEWELLIAKYLSSNNCLVQSLASADAKKTPVMMWPDGSYSCQLDILYWQDKTPKWAEIKFKNQWVTNFRGYETGFEADAFCVYGELSRRTGFELEYWFVQQATSKKQSDYDGVYKITHSEMEPYIRFWNGLTPDGKRVPGINGGMVYVTLDKLEKVCDINDILKLEL